MHWSVSVTECAPLWTWGWRSVTSRRRQCAVHQCVVEAATALWATTELGNWTQSVTKVDWTRRALDSPQILILRIQIAAKMLINTNSDTGDVGRKRLAALPLSIIQSSDKKMGKKIGTVPKGEDWVSLDARRRWRRRGKFGAHGEHGDVFPFSNLGALWFSENLIRYSLHVCLREVKNNLFSFKHSYLRHFSWRF